KNYVSRMPDEEHKKYKTLIRGLDLLIKKDKLGKKNKNGLLIGEPLPWKNNNKVNYKTVQLHDNFLDIFNKTCIQFVENKQISHGELHLVLQNLFN
ncbi:MAG: hypothetical protein P8Y99_09220, partial [Calditrichaceae bacterium]